MINSAHCADLAKIGGLRLRLNPVYRLKNVFAGAFSGGNGSGVRQARAALTTALPQAHRPQARRI